MNQDAKTTYAQSSDIKSRTYLEYRKDMKQKAIAELEILPWLQGTLQAKNNSIKVEKFGGDKYIWFLRNGGITRDPDFIIRLGNNTVKYIEFQYTKEVLKNYDFKISKIAPVDKKLKKRIPKSDTKILYLIKPLYRYALIEPKWIVDNGKETVAAAWGNAPVYRVAAEKFEKISKQDDKLKLICDKIDSKIKILDFQHCVIHQEEEKLSKVLQEVIDEEKIVKIIPKTLGGFFQVCFILTHLDKQPDNINLWLVYVLSYLNSTLNSYELFQLVYCLDYLYSKTELQENEFKAMIDGVKQIRKIVNEFYNKEGYYQSDKTLSSIEDTRYALFVINILEDLTQDMIFSYKISEGLKPVNVIFEDIPDIKKACEFIAK